jgi:5-methylcytosine-specific restriction endonuclease McrA
MARWGTDARLVSAGWKRQRLYVLNRDGYECTYCGEPANEVDHVISRKDGGTDDLDNLVAACRRCNNSKGAGQAAVFLLRTSTPPISSTALSPVTTSKPLSNPFQTRLSQNG